MITANSAIYIGIFTTCVLDNCPKAVINVERTFPGLQASGYTLTCVHKVGEGADARSVSSEHKFLDEETRSRSGGDLATAARMAGDQMGILLAGAR